MSINIELFISEIQSRQALWQSKHPNYCNRVRTKKLWREITEQFPGCEEKQLHKKWKNLRDQYRKEKKKIPTPRSGDGGDEIESTWPYFPLLQFLNDDIAAEVMTGNLQDSDSESVIDFSHAEQETATNTDVMSADVSTCSSRTSASKLKRSANYRDELLECEKRKISLIEQKMASNKDESEKCDDYHFFMSLVPQMKQFNDLQKLRIRNKITQVIIDEAERMQFSHHSRYEDNCEAYSNGNYDHNISTLTML